MQTSLRKMGNSTGMIVPRSILGEIGVTTGATMDLRVEDGKLIASPVVREPRTGWRSAAAAMTDEAPDADWLGFDTEDDAPATW